MSKTGKLIVRLILGAATGFGVQVQALEHRLAMVKILWFRLEGLPTMKQGTVHCTS